MTGESTARGRRRVFGAFSGLLVVSVCGCIGPHWVESGPLYDDGEIAVLLETRTHEGREVDEGFAHPAQVGPSWLDPFLASIRYNESRLIGGVKGKPVFDRQATSILARKVSEALAAARPSQRVRFRAVRTTSKLVILRSRRLSSGVAFVRPAGTIHVVFDRVDDAEEDEGGGSRYRGDPVAHELAYADIVPPPGSHLYRDPESGRQHRLWVVGDLSAPPPVATEEGGGRRPGGEPPSARTPAPAKPGARPAGKPPGKPPEPVASPSGEGRTPAAPATAPAARARPEGKKPGALPARRPSRDSFDEKIWEARIKLRYLEELRAGGLISEEQYLKAREELLETFDG